MERCTIFMILVSAFIGCGGSGGDTTEDTALPTQSSSTCGDFTVNLASDDVVQEETERLVQRVESLGNEVVEIRTQRDSVVVVGCGGTFIDNDPVTTTTVDVNSQGNSNPEVTP